ncbi:MULTISPECIES: polysaccharide biosynthesis protein [Sphingobacterium]|jgi:FlaA1/EpsC-like NDP-sugar epimerase|uniref:Capsular polysaccharide biosynthesis protein CapD n=1 Tax=Sphingobacterium multivorum TaxID=28454 RepID=A0A2X2KQY0_SPHMU|nr:MULTISPECIES: nucleoside-diphosphate sugar epimerase/dehydratase [Sphingobacterium]HAE66473.1 polysaccharide biosynthesis protein [Sphingobacterium sp.]MDF2851799.1 polysaccharide biosynthesis protein [Sphingobacterium multivorum]OFV19852.1 polysaccharide biosynthesis protein [Sphingobacterium sp. HMSC13C05]OJZ03254.1 MAG: polysaccharide biosynthesis protein [Sphingobacterium sp. 40-24]QQT43734.1 polysaccharide biosynthesis protein [Sphingobacterium multivorum]
MLSKVNIVPRWIIFLLDIFSVSVAYLLANVIYYDFNFDFLLDIDFSIRYILFIGVCSLSFYLFKMYTGIVRYTSAIDSIRILSTITFSVFVLLVIKLVIQANEIERNIPTALIIFFALFSFLILTVYRTIIKIFFLYTKKVNGSRKKTLIYGAGDLGIAVKRTLDHDVRSKNAIVGFLDDNDQKINKVIDGTKIYSSQKFSHLINTLNIEEVIIASHNIPSDRKNEITDVALEKNVNILTLPPVKKIMNGDLNPNQIQKIKIEDLLEREPIKINDDHILSQTKGKRILVTGAAGSIGSEIATQLGRYEPQMIILCDQAESPLHNLQLDLQDEFPNQVYHTYIADVRSTKRMQLLFDTFKPHYVYHAAAYKHVPMMENHPLEAVQTNVMGTKNLADLAVEFQVEKFVFVSTDKAVNPTNIMGATKRIAEIYVQSLNNHLENTLGASVHTKFITTRFGNVLGSNGSVIPRFRDQIQKGGPVTVTHPEITRYFMTIPEACRLVLEAGTMGQGGEIFVFDMGKSVKIVELAKKMIRLSGFKPNEDIEIKFTGLRPGEKLYEELLNDLENTLPTHHEKIMIAKVRENNYDRVCMKIGELQQRLATQNKNEVVYQMKIIVPEFKSKNSIYEQLDKEIELSNESENQS